MVAGCAGAHASAAARPARALIAGPAALRALRRPARGAVEVVLGRSFYLRLDDDRVLVTGPRAPLGPLSLTVAGLMPEGPSAGEPASCDGRLLAVAGLEIDLGGVRGPRAPAVPPRAAGLRGALAAALGAVPAPPSELEPGLRSLAGTGGKPSLLRRAVAQLVGRGDGLTPAGDDVLAGFAAWRRADGAPVRLSALAEGRTTALSLAYLGCAERGELPAPAARVLATVRRGDAPGAPATARALAGWGSSSGAALLWGMAAGAGALGAMSVDHERRQSSLPPVFSTSRSSETRTPRSRPLTMS